jgi:NADH-quinone oxidoreductase subunit J
MEFKTALFYAFSVILVFAALRVITARNPIHAALFLVLSFFSTAAIWMLLKAEFLAIVLVLVYVGAVMVLFLFVVMMLDMNLDKLRAGFWGHLPLAAGVGVLIVLQMAAVILSGFLNPNEQIPAVSDTIGTTKELGKIIYTQYIYAFEIAALLLLLAIVAAVALTLRRRKDTRYNNPSEAVRVRARDRIRIVSMKSESSRNAVDTPPVASAPEQK